MLLKFSWCLRCMSYRLWKWFWQHIYLFLVNFTLKLTTPFLLIFDLYVLPLTFKVTFLPALMYVLPLNGFLTVFNVTFTSFVFVDFLNFLLEAEMEVFFLTTVSLDDAMCDALYFSSPWKYSAYVYMFAIQWMIWSITHHISIIWHPNYIICSYIFQLYRH